MDKSRVPWEPEIVRAPGRCTVRLYGALDIEASEEVSAVLMRHACADGTDVLEADLSALVFIDSMGLAALIGAYRCAQTTGTTFVVTGARGIVARVLQVTGLQPILSGAR